MKNFEIRTCKNGYIIFDGGFDYGNVREIREPYVFETLDKALEWLRSRFMSHEIDTGPQPTDKK